MSAAGRKPGDEELRRFASTLGLPIRRVFRLDEHAEVPAGWWCQSDDGPLWLGTGLSQAKASLRRIKYGRQSLRIIGLPRELLQADARR